MDTNKRRNNEAEGEVLYKTKVVQFFGRSVPIILQNDNGPCPLIAISNVLLLRKNLNLSFDTSEISLQKLLSLVAERLIDSNSNVEDKDVGYMENQQQNIADVIDLLPRLATGIDVNLHFRKIDDFEFTPERAIFDLLGIELYHGWIVDPQDTDLLDAIGSKSYNTLIGELVALETRNPEGEDSGHLEEDCIDFAAATTATLGVPSPCLSRGRSFDDSPVSVASDQRARKGDVEEEELIQVLQLSKSDAPTSDELTDTNEHNMSTSSAESSISKNVISRVLTDSQGHNGEKYQEPEQPVILEGGSASNACDSDGLSSEVAGETDGLLSDVASAEHLIQSDINESQQCGSSHPIENIRTDFLVQNESVPFQFPDRDASATCDIYQDDKHNLAVDEPVTQTCAELTATFLLHLKPTNDSIKSPGSELTNEALLSPNGIIAPADESEGVSSSLEGSEPIYEGEERILDTGYSVYEDREPMYEGEVVLAKQSDGGPEGDNSAADEITQRYKGLSIDVQTGILIQNFLKSNASQLTIYGLFCLQEGLKEQELCVFFRNNHFSTMFKFNGELYLLATDQGYMNQPDLVWEKLNEVNGDTVFMTGTFKEFKAENQVNNWNEHNAMTSAADYIASMDKSVQADSALNSDLQLAIALQQQEFDQQPERQHPQNLQHSSASGQSRLVIGPQVSRGSHHPSSKQEGKSKDKCIVM